jgi:hypothetical protein
VNALSAQAGVVHKLRLAMMVNGVDCNGSPGGVISATHRHLLNRRTNSVPCCSCLVEKLDSRPSQSFIRISERKLAVILERESLKWLRPAKGQFQMFYRSGNDHLEYQPDFAEMDNCIIMLESKMASQMTDQDVLAKRDVAVEWCGWASERARTYNGKPWRYSLIPHDAIAENVTVEFLLEHHG